MVLHRRVEVLLLKQRPIHPPFFSLTYDVDALAFAAARPTDRIVATAGDLFGQESLTAPSK
jgi:hypothetical protein